MIFPASWSSASAARTTLRDAPNCSAKSRLGGDPFARLDAPLIDVALDRRLHLGDLLTRAHADVLA